MSYLATYYMRDEDEEESEEEERTGTVLPRAESPVRETDGLSGGSGTSSHSAAVADSEEVPATHAPVARAYEGYTLQIHLKLV